MDAIFEKVEQDRHISSYDVATDMPILIFEEPDSPVGVNGHRSRHRRQGAGLYLSASYIIPGGEGGGGWGEWGEQSPCSRTCGGGVASQKRICLEIGPDGQPRCTGGDTKYFSCQTQDCPAGSVDFRAEQCSQFDNVSSPAFRGIKYKWVPYTRGPNPCELNCMPQGERFYYRHREKVVDGTLCNEESFDVCVDGKCQPVGCDRMLGSTAKEDKCLNCRGNGVNCQTMKGLLDSQDLRQGYNDMMIIPAGATSIYITEAGDSSNYLALRSKLSSKNGTFYLNGDYHIDFPRSMTIAGATWYYERNQQGLPAPDKLRCQGPIDEPLVLVLLLQDQNVGIEYEYSIPTALAPKPDQQYNWVHEDFTPCSASCGGGFQTRNVTCRSREELEIVDDALCEESIRPPSNQTCSTDPCPAQWVEGPWSPCSKPCGQGGSRSRQVHCQKIITNGLPSLVADKECFDLLGPKPELFQECNGNASCPTWFTGPWKPCDKLCGQGKQTRAVVCHQKADGRVQVLSDEECVDEKPPAEQGCILHPCDGVDWVLTEWSGCDSCLSKVRTRSAECATKYKEVVNASFCAYHPEPVLEEPCEESELPDCDVQWYATQWSNCSTDCGKGVQTRKVFCGLFEKDSVVMVNDSQCGHLPKYNDTKPCEIPKEKCPAKWYAGPWGVCTKTCGGGEQHRRVMCLRENKEVDSCDYLSILDSTKSCNTGRCNGDDVIPLDSKSTPIMDDEYEYDDRDCVEEGVTESGEEGEYEEAGAEESLSTIDDMMFSDSPSTFEGSGFSTFTETELGSGETGSGETDITEVTTETSSDLSTVSSNDTESTESSEATESTLSGATDETSESGPTSESGATDESEATSESGPTSESGATESDVTTESGTTSESGATETTESGATDETTESGATETEVTSSSISEETSESGATDESTEFSVTESGSTDVTESSSETSSTDGSSPTDETSETSSTDESSESSPTDESTESTSESSVSGSDETTSSDETTDSSTTELSTDETTSSGDTDSTSEGSTESSSTDESSESTGETSSDLSTESGATDLTTESGTEESTVSGSDVTTESGMTEESTTSGSSEGSTETEETEATEISTTEVTGTEPTGLTESTEFSTTESTDSSGYSTESTESTQTEETEGTLEGSSTTEMSSEESTTEGGSTLYDWSTTLGVTSPKVCKRRKKSKCKRSKFGCCPDNRTPAAGPFDAGCPIPETCKESKFGCCPDGVSPATGEKDQGCPVPPCNETLFGCCLSDNKTAAEGNDQEGCPPMPPACKSSKFGCCADGETGATGSKKAGCPETEAKKKAEEEKKKEKQRQKEAKKKAEACKKAKFGCCYDNVTLATGPDKEGCPCNTSQFGCCPDNNSTATGPNLEGCLPSCASSTFGCCPDNETAAHGYEKEGCCLLYPHGCCPDNYMPAQGPNHEGCECQITRYGCCPDNATIAKGPDNQGCGCQYTEHGCCPDNHTPASGPNFEGCGCHTYQFGCCDDGERAAKGPNKQGCHCRESEFGCCGDEKTPASGPEKQGCNCANSKYGCCPDGHTEAQGTKFRGCTDVPENKQAACSMASDRGSCRNYSVYWFYDMEYGGCSRFWYGGCEGNGNRFTSKEECEDVCVQPAPKDACKLPQVKGACLGYHLRWYYDSKLERCSQFIFGGCLGNANNFDSEELCKKQCEPERSADQCELPLAPGSCAGVYPRWGFNPESKRCEQFTWGGCEGNPNRFSTEAACKERCDPPGRPKPVCSKPQEAGNCTEKIPAWSFSQTDNRCVPFYYTGCGGNDNRFTYEVHCSETCPPAYVKDVCELPAEIGDCADYRQNWYYDTAQKRCLQFYYGGCGGNENNFPTLAQCEARCSEPVTTTTTAQPPITSQPATQPATPQQAPPGQEYCFLELDAGPCDRMETRWGYDSARGQCVTFQYGGCGGNRNNFPDVEYCQYYCNNPQDICQLPMMSGPCDGSEMKWFYDPRSDSCSQFTYGGCEGNGNRFDSLDACESRCRTGPAAAVDTTTTTTTVAPVIQPQVEEIPPECQVSPTAEECVEAGTVWYLDPEQRACVAYENAASGAGCRRTGVFPSEEACMRSCGPFRNIDVCAYPVDAGPCREAIRKYYFERATGACLEFSFGGCHGGPNRFSSLDECEQTCIPQPEDPCAQPLEPGNCVYSYPMWYYDAARDACNQFSYSGCNGNDNKFDSREDCEGRCVRQRATTPPAPVATPPPQPVDENCRPPPSEAPCGANITAFYYDESSRSCRATEAGGCRYQGIYQTEEECERKCGAFKGIDVCRYSLDVGPCKASIPKFYFDLTTGRCEPYAYGGCGGSPNRFSTADECQRICAPEGPDASCLEEVDTGAACGELSSRRYYYSPQDAECLPFIYSGCGGTNNNYFSLEQCTQLCKRTPIFDSRENEVTPDCSAYTEECSRLSCQFGVQRSHTAGGCERCSCVQVEVDCAQLEQDCENLRCTYSMEKTVGEDGCTRCKCISHPCQDKECPAGERCVASAYRDPITQDLRYSADCKTVNKPGSCPPEAALWTTESQCRLECNDDADCRGVGKCCVSGCSHLCLEPVTATTPFPHTTTYSPELPQAPYRDLHTEPEVTAQEGGVATLRCLFHGNPPPKITWRKGEITIDGSVGRYRLLSDGALEIVSLYRNDSGVYICLAENIHGKQHQEIRLQINDPVDMPAGISGDANAVVTGDLGQSITLRCMAFGYPPPTIVWHRGITGPMVPFSSSLYEARGYTLFIRKLNEETLGEYTCEAYNGVGKPTSWSIVVHAYRPEARWAGPAAQEVLVTQRAPLTTSTTYAPEITVPVYTVPVRTRIAAESTTLAPGAELNLPCEVDGYPLPSVYWSKDGAPLSPNSRTQITESRLTITGLTPADGGVYGCHASNAYSSHQDSVNISVQGIYIPANCTDNPFFANCHLIVQSKFCQHKYYSKFCCKSCMQAGQLNPQEFEQQADQPWDRK